MFWTLFLILIVFWLLGWGFHVAGNFIHVLLAVALIVALVEILGGRRAI